MAYIIAFLSTYMSEYKQSAMVREEAGSLHLDDGVNHYPPNRPLSLQEGGKYHLEPQGDLDCEGMLVDGYCGWRVFDDIGSGPAGGLVSGKQGKWYGDQVSKMMLNGILHLIWAIGKEGRLLDSVVEADLGCSFWWLGEVLKHSSCQLLTYTNTHGLLTA